MLKRAFDLIASFIGLALLSPILALLANAVRRSSSGPALFRQERVGRSGRTFVVLKFRTMAEKPETTKYTQYTNGLTSTFDAGNTDRVTPVGRVLRKWKLDELPQLWNVLRGDMALVGPRPEVRKWVETYPERWARVLTVRPGITDPASIAYRNEETLLASAPDSERTYREVVLPHKLDLYEEYVRTRSFWGDLGILFRTVGVLGKAEKRKTENGNEKTNNTRK